MAAHWAWSFSVQGAIADYSNAGWGMLGGVLPAAVLAHHPVVGYGGDAYACRVNAFSQAVVSPLFPKGVLADGIIQMHVYADAWSSTSTLLQLFDTTGTVELLRVRPSAAGGVSAFNIYSQEGGALTLRGTTTGTLSAGAWHTIAVRFKPNGVVGEIQISLDGVSENIVVAGAVGATSSWGRYGTIGNDGINVWHGQVGVWDSAADDALTVTYWTPILKPKNDVSIGAYLDQGGGAVNLYLAIDEAVPSTADYARSTTALDTIKLGVNTADINASWTPTTIAGILVVCSARGELALNSARPVLGKPASADVLGTLQTTTANSSFGVNDLFTTQANGAGWDVAGVDAGEYGMRTT